VPIEAKLGGCRALAIREMAAGHALSWALLAEGLVVSGSPTGAFAKFLIEFGESVLAIEIAKPELDGRAESAAEAGEDVLPL
jgi:hypothetical protein